MAEYSSVLTFEKYIVNNIKFEANNKYENHGNTPIELAIKSKTEQKEDGFNITLVLELFSLAEENNYPFHMELEVTGYFKVANNNAQIDLRPNAIAILYPYLRAIVSTYTSAANVNALILPTINVNKVLENETKI